MSIANSLIGNDRRIKGPKDRPRSTAASPDSVERAALYPLPRCKTPGGIRGSTTDRRFVTQPRNMKGRFRPLLIPDHELLQKQQWD